jgi:hypothetical protein
MVVASRLPVDRVEDPDDGPEWQPCPGGPWHGRGFGIAGGWWPAGSASAPQPGFEIREVGVIRACLPGAGLSARRFA